MKLSTRARYALRSMIEIVRDTRDGVPVSLESVGRRTGLSRRYLEQLAIDLKKAGLLRGVSGRRGGYLLKVDPADIRIGAIIEAAIGPISIVDCVAHAETCMRAETCECRVLYSLINQQVTEVLNRYTLAEVADRGWLQFARQEIGKQEARPRWKPLDQKVSSVLHGCPGFESPKK